MVDPSDTGSYPSAIERRIERLGLPLFMLSIVFYMIWRLSLWLQPRFDATITGHLEFLKKTVETQEKQVVNSEKIVEQTSKLATIAERQDKRIEDIHKAVIKDRNE